MYDFYYTQLDIMLSKFSMVNFIRAPGDILDTNKISMKFILDSEYEFILVSEPRCPGQWRVVINPGPLQ